MESSNEEVIIKSPKMNYMMKYVESTRNLLDHYISYTPTTFDISCIGMNIAIAGCFYSFYFQLFEGFGGFFIQLMVILLAFMTYLPALAEMNSTLPLPGGAYSMARCVYGFYYGYLVGCCELLAYLLLGSVNISNAFELIFSMYDWESTHSTFFGYTFIIYVVCTLTVCMNGKVFWILNTFFGLLMITVLLLYICGSFKSINFYTNGRLTDDYYVYRVPDSNTTVTNVWFNNGLVYWLKYLPSMVYTNYGIDAICFTRNDCKDARDRLPVAYIIATIILMVIMPLVIVCSSFQYPIGIEVTYGHVFQNVFMDIYKMSYNQMLWLVYIPSYLASGYSTFYIYGKILSAMAGSKILPSIFRKEYGNSKIPIPAILLGSGLSYGCLVAQFYWLKFSFYSTDILTICMCFIYISQCFQYYLFVYRYKELGRSFRSPFGLPGIAFSGIIFLICIASAIGLQNDNYFSVTIFASYIGIATIHYRIFISGSQKFSDDELKLIFRELIVDFNENNRKKMRNRNTNAVVPLWKGFTTSNNNKSCSKSISKDISVDKYKSKQDHKSMSETDMKRQNKSSSYYSNTEKTTDTFTRMKIYISDLFQLQRRTLPMTYIADRNQTISETDARKKSNFISNVNSKNNSKNNSINFSKSKCIIPNEDLHPVIEQAHSECIAGDVLYVS